MTERHSSMLFLEDDRQLVPGDAVAAVIVVGDRYLLQLRDTIAGIFFPGCWGFFGGAIEDGEAEEDALRREIYEELGLVLAPGEGRRFFSLTFDFTPDFNAPIARVFYELVLDDSRIRGLRQREGASMALLTAAEAHAPGRRLAPYDSFALWVHTAAHRLHLPSHAQ